MTATRILFVIKDGWSARYLLRTDILSTVKEAGAEVGILTPNADEDYFVKEFQDDRTSVLPLDMEAQFAYLARHPLNAVCKVLRGFVIKDTGNLSTLDGFYEKYRGKRWPGGQPAARLLDGGIWALRRSKILREALYHFENAFFPGPEQMRVLLEGFAPDVLVGVTLGHFLPELYAMRQARRLGVKLVTVVQSWDNDAKFGMAGVRPDLVLTWSDTLTREMIRCHELDPAKVMTVGVPHFDVYARPELLPSREEFCARMGLDPDPRRKLIFFATKAPQNFPYNTDIVELLEQAMSHGRLAAPCQLLVRMHPQYFRKGYQAVDKQALEVFLQRYRSICERNRHVVLNKPVILSDKLDMDRPFEDMIELGAILRYSDVVVNPFSTLNVEASIFDVPVVNVGFDGYGNSPYVHPSYRSIALDEQHVHNQRMLATGCTKVAYTPEELIERINDYLLHPEKDREGRRRLARQECGVIDGQAGRRAGLAILKLARGG